MKTRDIDIRNKLHNEFKTKYLREPNTIIVDELGLCQGDARIDIAIVNGHLHGFEIKSESDTLERLPSQIKIYSRVMDKVTIVTGENHVEKVSNLVPDWWGIKVVIHNKNSFNFKSIKRPKQNKNVDPFALVQLLWKEEALGILEHFALDKGVRSKSRVEMWERLVNNLSIDELKYHVRETLKSRKGWRADL